MELQDQNMENDRMWRKMEKAHRRGKIMGGLLIVAIGSLFLVREIDRDLLPPWLFTWKMLLIGLGVVTAVKHKFMHPGWLVLILIGGAFLLNDFYPDMQIKPFILPLVLILLGLFVIFKPKNRRKQMMHRYWAKKWHEHRQSPDYRTHQNPFHRPYEGMCEETTNDDRVSTTTVFAGIKKNVLSKNFKGGEVTNVFGGTELNLMQADFEGEVTLEVTQIFGGTKLIVPAHWEVKSTETVAVLGSVEDKRPAQAQMGNETKKTLVLIGTVVFGGIEIKSF